MKRAMLLFIIVITMMAANAWADEPAFVPERRVILQSSTLFADEGFSSPVVYDWNNDGKKDLVSATGSGKIYVYINQGSDTSPVFNTGTPIQYKGSTLIVPSTYNPFFAYISTNSDLNGDGLDDLLVGVNNKIYIYRNTGSVGNPSFNSEKTQILLLNAGGQLGQVENDVGAFEYATGAQAVVGSYPITGYYNLDGILDIVSAYSYLDATGRFHHCVVVYSNMGTAAQWNFQMIVGFVTNIKKIPTIDIINGNLQGEFLNQRVWYVYPYDWNGDSFIDLVGCYNTAAEDDRLGGSVPKNIGAEKIKLVWYAGPVFAPQGEILNNKGESINMPVISPPCVTRWDGDANADILIGNHIGFISLLKGTANPNVVNVAGDYTRDIQVTTANPLFGWSSLAVNTVDWNNDGKYDLLFGNLYARNFIVLNEGNNQNPVYRMINTVTIGTGVYKRIPVRNVISFPDFIDINNDGLKDLIIGGGRSENFVIFTNINNNSNPIFTTNVRTLKAAGQDVVTAGISGGYSMCSAADWNADGLTDLLTIGGDGVFMRYLSQASNLANLGAGDNLRYVNGDIISLGYISSKPYVLDWDGDGDKDLICAAQAKVFIFLNQGTDQNKKFYDKKELKYGSDTFNPGDYPRINVLDFNGDGYWDIVMGDVYGIFNIFFGGPARYVSEDDVLLPEDRVIPYPNPLKKNFINQTLTDIHYINAVANIERTMNIEFSIRDDAIVEIFIYNLAGKLVDKIYGEAKYNYKNIALFNIENLANGVYIVKIMATSVLNKEETTVIKKVALTR
ncbi:MAG: T9SS type A sorting domain-containing protein [Spirochaetes bacterium]|nr:T9SS type A sorting domain-containing protein [Spirochaetota bacterium]